MLQLISLNELEEQQLMNIAEISDINSYLVITDTKHQLNILNTIEAEEYTHILLSSEHALFKEIKEVLMKIKLQTKIKLVVIDKCHLIHQ